MKSVLKRSRVKSVNQLIKPYPGRWVALSFDDTHVVSVRKSFEAALDEAHRKGESCPHKILKNHLFLVHLNSL
jgi:hypothetical protein